jgi:hypothetical protein
VNTILKPLRILSIFIVINILINIRFKYNIRKKNFILKNRDFWTDNLIYINEIIKKICKEKIRLMVE